MADKEQVELLDERIISNRGLIVHTPDPLYRRFHLQVDVIRTPQTNFVNKNTNPDISDYGRITFMRQGQVLRLERIRFDQEVFVWDVDITGYIAKALTCAFKGIFAYLIAIGEALSIPPGATSDIFIEPIQDQFDQILFVVRTDAAIAVQLYGLKYDIACPEADPVEQPPPPPPDFPNYPPGEPLSETDTPASPPYDPPDDAGNTVPLPDDVAEEEPPEPEFPDCTRVRVTMNVKLVGVAPFNIGVVVFAPFGGSVTIKSGFPKVAEAMHRGQSPSPTPPSPCLDYQMRDMISFSDNIETISVVSVELA